MSELKFACPVCEQHICCNKTCVGRVVTCPTCEADIRVPICDNPFEKSMPRGLLVNPPPPGTRFSVLQQPTATANSSPAPTPEPAEAKCASAPKECAQETPKPKPAEPVAQPTPAPSPFSVPKTGTATPAERTDVPCLCPVCQSELRVSTVPQAGVPVALLVRRGSAAPQPAPKAAPANDLDHMSPEERDRQIAAARATRQVSLYPAMKPRLEYILQGKSPTPDSKESPATPPPSPPMRTFSE
jgi:hypothetical protein